MRAGTVLPALIGMVLQNVLMLGTGIMVARTIGSADYGVSNLMRSLLQFMLMLAPLGLDVALQKHVGAAADEDQARVRADVNRLRLLVVGGTTLAVLTLPLGVGDWINRSFYRVPHLETYLIITFAALPMMTDLQILGGVLRARHNPNPQVICNYYIQPILRLAMLIVFLKLGWGLTGVLVSNTLGFLISFLLINGYFHFRQDRDLKPLPPAERPRWRESIGLMETALWIAASVFFYSTIRNIDVIVLGTARPMKEVGEYGSLSTFAQFAQFFPQALALTLGPTVARCYASGDYRGIETSLSSYLRIASMLAAPIFAAAVAWGPALDLVFGKSFTYTQSVAALLPLGFFVSGVLSPMGFALSMTGRHRIETYILVAGNLFVVACCMLTAKPFGQVGVAASVFAGYIGINILRFQAVQRAFKMRPGSLADFLPPILCVALAVAIKVLAFAVFPRNLATFLGSGIVFGLVAMGAYWLFLLNGTEKAWLLKAARMERFKAALSFGK